MSGVTTFFRHCPSCGRRFQVRLVSEEVVSASEYEETKQKGSAVTYAAGMRRINVAIQLSEGNPVTTPVHELDAVEVMKYDFKCKHCGHEWSEESERTVEGRPEAGYTGD
jgi:transposase-like protein